MLALDQGGSPNPNHNTWEKNQGIRTAEDDLAPDAKNLLHRFFFVIAANCTTDDITNSTFPSNDGGC